MRGKLLFHTWCFLPWWKTANIATPLACLCPFKRVIPSEKRRFGRRPFSSLPSSSFFSSSIPFLFLFLYFSLFLLPFLCCFFFLIFICLYLAALSLCCYAQAFSSFCEWGLFSNCGEWASHCRGFSCYSTGFRCVDLSSCGMEALKLWLNA